LLLLALLYSNKISSASPSVTFYHASLFIHPDSAGKILKIERLINGYLIKKFPDNIDTSATDILDKVVQLSTGVKTCDFSILRDQYEEWEQIRTHDDLR